MYSEQQKSAYQSIKAPCDLREKVLAACDSPQPVTPWYLGRPIRLACSMAALFLFCFLGISQWQNGSNDLSIQASGPITSDGSVNISAEPLMVSEENPELARFTQESDTISICLELELPSPAEITISGGEAVFEQTDSTILTSDISYSSDSNLTILWTVSTEASDYEMTISCKNVTYSLPLTYDGNKDSWMIRCLEQ